MEYHVSTRTPLIDKDPVFDYENHFNTDKSETHALNTSHFKPNVFTLLIFKCLNLTSFCADFQSNFF